jgi:hypothetical protein
MLEPMAEPWRSMAKHLQSLLLENRQAIWDLMMLARGDRDELVKVLAAVDPLGPQPTDPRRWYATAADVGQSASGKPWRWEGWIPPNRIVGVAAGEGVGKTRFLLDLCRRVWLGIPWPDEQPMTLPAQTPSLWICADGHHDEIAEILPNLGLPPDSVVFPAEREDPYDHTSLDVAETLEYIEGAIVDLKPWCMVVDSLTYATTSDVCEQRSIARLKAPLVRLAQIHEIIVLLSLHMSREGQALGRRVKGITRTLMHLECPDPDRPERLSLWVEKSYAKRPPPLGVTMTDSGNDYDSDPPARSDPSKGARPPERREHARQFIVGELIKRNDSKATDLCNLYEEAGGAKGTFRNARDDMVQAAELVCNGRPLVMHLVPDSQSKNQKP